MSIYDEPKLPDAVTLKRQADCPHTVDRFIKGLADDVPRCPFCGESKASLEARMAQWSNAVYQNYGQPKP